MRTMKGRIIGRKKKGGKRGPMPETNRKGLEEKDGKI